jgi:hypothetical protein
MRFSDVSPSSLVNEKSGVSVLARKSARTIAGSARVRKFIVFSKEMVDGCGEMVLSQGLSG